jgi:amidase
LKPSRGRVTWGPDTDEANNGMAVEFAVSRTVRDTAVLLDAVSAPASGDPFVIIQPKRPFREEVGAPVEKLRIAFTTKSWWPGDVDPEVAKAIEAVAGQCESMGHVVEEASPSYNTENAFLGRKVNWISYKLNCDMLSLKLKHPIDSNHLEPVSLATYQSAKKLSAEDMFIAKVRLNAVRREIAPFFNKYDLLLTSTTSVPAVPFGKLDTNHDISPDEHIHKFEGFCPNTGVFNVTGQPAISLPLAMSESGLPIGAHFIARFGEEATLIRLAGAFEEAMPWRDRKPPVHASNSI